MVPKTAAVFGIAGAYLVWRYYHIADSSVTLAEDIGSTVSTIGAWVMPGEIPFECKNPNTGVDYKPQIYYSARLTGVPPLLLAALLRQESKFNPGVVNTRTGASGIAQFMPATAREWFGADWQSGVFNPERAIHQAARYLAWLYRQHGTWRLAVAAYNWGTGLLSRNGLALAPKETRDYVRIVYDAWAGQLPA